MSSLFSGGSPFQRVPTPLTPNQGGAASASSQPQSVPMDGFAMGPSPTATPNPSRAGSARHGSFERETHSDVFGRRTSTPATTRGNSRVNSPRPSSVRSMMGDEDEDRRSRDRRQDRSEDPVGMRQRLEAIEITLKTHATDIGVSLRNYDFSSKTRKLIARTAMEEPIAHQCRDGIGPNILIDPHRACRHVKCVRVNRQRF